MAAIRALDSKLHMVEYNKMCFLWISDDFM